MTTPPWSASRPPPDAPAVGALLHDFNAEFDEPTPPADALAARIVRADRRRRVRARAAVPVPDGVAVLRFRPALWTANLECYLAELYVVPQRRGHGLGRA